MMMQMLVDFRCPRVTRATLQQDLEFANFKRRPKHDIHLNAFLA